MAPAEASILLAPKAPKQKFGCQPQGEDRGGVQGGDYPPPPAVYGRSTTSLVQAALPHPCGPYPMTGLENVQFPTAHLPGEWPMNQRSSLPPVHHPPSQPSPANSPGQATEGHSSSPPPGLADCAHVVATPPPTPPQPGSQCSRGGKLPHDPCRKQPHTPAGQAKPSRTR